jgi:hypothetical protein
MEPSLPESNRGGGVAREDGALGCTLGREGGDIASVELRGVVHPIRVLGPPGLLGRGAALNGGVILGRTTPPLPETFSGGVGRTGATFGDLAVLTDDAYARLGVDDDGGDGDGFLGSMAQCSARESARVPPTR